MSPRKRLRNVGCRVTEHELSAWNRFAEANDSSLARIIRFVMNERVRAFFGENQPVKEASEPEPVGALEEL